MSGTSLEKKDEGRIVQKKDAGCRRQFAVGMIDDFGFRGGSQPRARGNVSKPCTGLWDRRTPQLRAIENWRNLTNVGEIVNDSYPIATCFRTSSCPKR